MFRSWLHLSPTEGADAAPRIRIHATGGRRERFHSSEAPLMSSFHKPLALAHSPPSPSFQSNSTFKMRTAELTPEDEQYLALVEHQRDHEMKLPLLSNFRVLALFAYEDLEGNHKHVIGANCECANIGGALCAERSAICQLQLLPVKRVRKVYIVSDADVCLTPGTLCREFLSSSPLFTRQTPFIMRASNCKPCTATLEELYPFPSIYDRIGKNDILTYAHAFCENATNAATEPINGTRTSDGNYPAFVALQLQSMSPAERAVYLAAFNATKYDKRDDLFPIRYAAATLFSDGDIKVTWQHKTLEYGSSLDALSKLIPFIDEKQLGTGTYARFDVQEGKMVPADERAVAQPVFVVQVDQFGILHAPFARVRAFFYEYDFQELIVLVHDQSGELNRVAMGNLIAESPDCIAASTGAPAS